MAVGKARDSIALPPLSDDAEVTADPDVCTGAAAPATGGGATGLLTKSGFFNRVCIW